jgi:hypothetical protein
MAYPKFPQAPPLHVPDVWHASGAGQDFGVPAHTALELHWPLIMQGLPVSHIVPGIAVGLEHAPLAGLHMPAT